MENTNENKVLAIGLDGATPDLLFQWAKEGKLPNLKNMMGEGAYGKLRSIVPPLTGPVWASFMTGKNPGKSGIFHFVKRDGMKLRLFNSNDLPVKTIWEILSDNNKKVGVVHVPLTFPPKKVNGFLVSGLGTPDHESNFTYPPMLKETLLRDFDYRIHTGDFSMQRQSVKFEGNKDLDEELLKDIILTEEIRWKASLHLMKEYDPDFFMVLFEGIDIASHFYWKYMDDKHPDNNPARAEKYRDAIEKVYIKMDTIIGDFLSNIDSSTSVIILSDHGFGPLYKTVSLNIWLESKGLLRRRRDILNRFPITKFFKSRNNGFFSKFDWSKTRAFSFGSYGLIFINVKGREPEGIVEPGEEYEELRNHIIQELNELDDQKTGKNIVKVVHKREEVYSGPFLEKMPDLIIEFESSYLDNPGFSQPIIRDGGIKSSTHLWPIDMSGRHSMDGILLMKGKNIKSDYTIKNAGMLDLAPTILNILGVDIPKDMDGKVLKELFTY